jgi:hypothetical protein
MLVTVTAADGTVTEVEAASLSFTVEAGRSVNYEQTPDISPAEFGPTGEIYAHAGVVRRKYTITEVVTPEFSLG